jgi:hypothetical protein
MGTGIAITMTGLRGAMPRLLPLPLHGATIDSTLLELPSQRTHKVAIGVKQALLQLGATFRLHRHLTTVTGQVGQRFRLHRTT